MTIPNLRSILIVCLILSFTPTAGKTASNDAEIETPGLETMGGDFQTWLLPDGAVIRLGMGEISSDDKAVYFLPDGQRLAVESSSGIWLYDVQTFRPLALLPTYLRGLAGWDNISYTPDMTTLAFGFGFFIELWDVATRTQTSTLYFQDGMRAVALSSDGTVLAAGVYSGAIKLWDLETGDETAILDHGSRMTCLVFSPDGAILASGGAEENLVKLWNASTGANTATLEGHEGTIASLTFSPDGTALASGSYDQTVRVWDVETGTRSVILEGHGREVTSVAFSPDGENLITGEYAVSDTGIEEAAVRLWNAGTGAQVATFSPHGYHISSVAYGPDGTTIASGSSSDGTVKVWDIATGNSFYLPGHTNEITTLAFTPDGTTIASGSSSGRTVKVWDIATGNSVSFPGHTGDIRAVAFSPDGTTLAVAAGLAIKLWNTETREPIRTLKGHKSRVRSVSFRRKGAILASGSNDNTVKLWDVASGKEMVTLERHTDGVHQVLFSPDGATLASAGSDGTVILWHVRTRNPIAALEGPRFGVNSVAFSPDLPILAAASNDGTIKLWDLETLVIVATLDGHLNAANSVSFSPDGTTLASAGGKAILWDVESGEQILSLDGHVSGITAVSFSPDGFLLATGSYDGTILLWDLQPPQPQTVAKLSGDDQQGLPGSTLPEPFVVSVQDKNGAAFDGAVVTFSVAAGGGTLSATTAITDADGRAAVTLTLGSDPGRNTVAVKVADLKPVIFSSTAQAIPTNIAKVSGDEQEGPTGAVLVEPFVVVVLDQIDNPSEGTEVTFAVTAGDGTLSATTATTDDKGRASTILTLGLPGAHTVTVSVAGLEAVTFTATAEATPDFDGDGETGFSDFFLFADAFGGSDPRFDLDGSGTVDFADFFLLADKFGDSARGKLLVLAREMIGLPDGPQLQQNAPNPFNSETVISWFLLRPGPARVEVYALTGQRVAVLHRGKKNAGFYRIHWDGHDERGDPLASGVYLYRLVTDERVHTRKLTLLR